MIAPDSSSEQRALGFTLIELVIALAIIGLISLLLFSGLRLGSRSWEAVERVSGQISDLRLVDGFLRRTLSQARPATATYEGAPILVFAGDTERLELVAPLSAHVGVSGLYILRLEVEEHAVGLALVMTRWYLHDEILEGGDDYPAWEPLAEAGIGRLADYPTDMDAAEGAFGRTLLLEGLSELYLSYYGQIQGDTELDWHDEWLDQRQLPALIRLGFGTERQAWPDLIVALPNQ
ncbi:prepilin-type N-terminal cleavage/methylation domain-containing protein [Thiorhodococcus minor]|uniref:prepilin-type N-terminal cleavage/methylation domain-containing protein n=1 Tax=Thiorhodococcus minor TaxID=57489 RepID=UPI0031596161